MLFIDEVHRFSKTQQDALLAGGREPLVLLVAATTENPSFSVVSPLLSRSLVLTLQPLTDDDVAQPCCDRAVADPRGLGGAVDARRRRPRTHLVRLAGGDARRRADRAGGGGRRAWRAGASTDRPRAAVERAVDRGRRALRPRRRPALRRDQRVHQVDPRLATSDAALHYLARMLEAGEDPRFIARRLMMHASEDIGLADPTALQRRSPRPRPWS